MEVTENPSRVLKNETARLLLIPELHLDGIITTMKVSDKKPAYRNGSKWTHFSDQTHHYLVSDRFKNTVYGFSDYLGNSLDITRYVFDGESSFTKTVIG